MIIKSELHSLTSNVAVVVPSLCIVLQFYIARTTRSSSLFDTIFVTQSK